VPQECYLLTGEVQFLHCFDNPALSHLNFSAHRLNPIDQIFLLDNLLVEIATEAFQLVALNGILTFNLQQFILEFRNRLVTFGQLQLQFLCTCLFVLDLSRAMSKMFNILLQLAYSVLCGLLATFGS